MCMHIGPLQPYLEVLCGSKAHFLGALTFLLSVTVCN